MRAREGLGGLLIVAIAAVVGCAPTTPTHLESDLLIRGGLLVDGTGAPPQRADLAITDGRVEAIGDLGDRSARRTIDASGLVVAPGWIDLHSHADLILLAEPVVQHRLLEARLRQGVTTLIVGNCGLGPAPADEPAAAILADVNGWMTPHDVSTGALDTAGYLDRLATGGVAINVGTLAPHGPLRITAMGLAAGAAEDAALAAMRHQLGLALDAGAFGLSVGLIYPPGMFAPTDELVALASEVAARDRLFTAHVRGSSETLIAATEELVEISRRSGARVHHSHLEAVGETHWDDVAQVLALEDRAREEGLRVSHEVFLYTRAATMMAAIFPPWSLEGGVPALLARLRDPATRERIADEIARARPEWPPWQPGGWPHNLVGAVGWDGIVVASVGADGPTELVGRSLAEIAESEGRPPFDVVADLMLSQDGRVGQLVDEISGRGNRGDVLLSIFRHPAAAVVSDAEDYGRGTPHPAHAGAFVRALRIGREHALPIEETIRRMTGYPASLLGLDDRGVLRTGAAADVVLLDPATVTDHADWTHPRRPATGIRWVLVNGTPIIDEGTYHPTTAGQVLRAE